jgi:S-adenosylmethionine:diacylglycerol 3-amino-3-carboxypropyl transferase
MKAVSDKVVFGHMHEDHSLELSLVARLPLKRALVIASGGDLAFGLAGEKVEVVAVDSNPGQIELVRLKMQCPPNLAELCFRGRVDRVFRLGGPFLAWLFNWPQMKPGRFRVFLADFLEGLLPRVVALVHGPRAGARLNGDAVRLIRCRLERAMKKPDGGTNPLLQVLLGKRFGPEPPEVWQESGIERWRSETNRIQLITADAARVLAASPTGSFGLISLSNLPDAVEREAWDEMVALAADALAPGGYLIARSMLTDSIISRHDGCFNLDQPVFEDVSPLCPVVWVGTKR